MAIKYVKNPKTRKYERKKVATPTKKRVTGAGARRDKKLRDAERKALGKKRRK